MDVKKPTTFEEQLSIIRAKGFVVEDEEKCLNLLNHVNYYALSAYFLPFKTKNNSFEKNVDFMRIDRIYRFDRKIRSLIFSITQSIEIYLRTQISYYYVHKYGALGYLSADNYSNKHNHNIFMEKLEKECVEAQSKTLVVQHHKRKYDGKFPLWVIIEYFSMGMLSHFYSDLAVPDQKNLAKNLFNTSSQHLKSWLICLTILRNKCAHYSRLYFLNFPSIPKLRPEDQQIISPSRKLFEQILMLKYLYSSFENWSVDGFLPLYDLILEYEDSIDLKHIGFPDNWEEILK